MGRAILAKPLTNLLQYKHKSVKVLILFMGSGHCLTALVLSGSVWTFEIIWSLGI